MSTPEDPDQRDAASDFARQAQEKGRGFVAEFVDFLRQNRKWWLIPVIVVLLLVGLLGVLGGTALAPFIYTLF